MVGALLFSRPTTFVSRQSLAYLGLGFIPQHTESDHEDRWWRVFGQLAQSRRNSEGKDDEQE